MFNSSVAGTNFQREVLTSIHEVNNFHCEAIKLTRNPPAPLEVEKNFPQALKGKSAMPFSFSLPLPLPLPVFQSAIFVPKIFLHAIRNALLLPLLFLYILV